MLLDAKKILKLLEHDGPLSRHIKGFEARESQKAMMEQVIDAYNTGAISLVEAGTGTGKSLAYLLPALLFAYHQKQKTVISTRTITLQEQLLYKDIPLIKKALGLDLKAVMVKGMGNYLCIRKLEEEYAGLRLLPSEEAEEIERIEASRSQEFQGCRSSLSFNPSSTVWEKVCAENDTCSRNLCSYFNQCYFFKARRPMQDAHLLIVNHSLLCADLALKGQSEQESGILPEFHHLVLDEAHHIEDVATEYFAQKLTQLGILKTIGRLASEGKGKEYGKLPLLKQKIQDYSLKNRQKNFQNIHQRFNIELPALRQKLVHAIFECFEVFSELLSYFRNDTSSEDSQENKLRILPFHHQHHHWQQKVVEKGTACVEVCKQYCSTIYGLESQFKGIKDEHFEDLTKDLRNDIIAYVRRLEKSQEQLEKFLNPLSTKERVRWIEIQQLSRGKNVHLIDAGLDISDAMVCYLFKKLSTIIFCSATLTTHKTFDFIKKRLGISSSELADRRITEGIYSSPFDYTKQTLLGIPTDLPSPKHDNFISSATETIWQTIKACHGNAFVLFTSYGMMKKCSQLLENHFYSGGFPFMKQGDENRHVLLERFKKTKRAVLFGTDTFWEGVDVVGDALRCVIIVKLPFKVPSEPIIQARTEAIRARGEDPFLHYSLPLAIMKFKQGFGRLIRHKEDRGCVVCLDSRLLNTNYGKQFLNSIPECMCAFSKSEELEISVRSFYSKKKLNE